MATNTRKLSDFLAEGSGDTFGDLPMDKPHITPDTLYPAWHGLLDNHTAYTFTDSGATGHTITSYNEAHHSGSNKKIGSTSIAVGNDLGYFSVPDHADWEIGTGDFTIEMWIHASNMHTGTHVYAMDFQDTSGDRITLTSRAGASSGLWYGTGWGNTGTAYAWPANEWFHVALCRQGGTGRAYLNGVQKETLSSWTTNFGGTFTITFGINASPVAAHALDGYLDEIRFSNVCRYNDGTTFTPSTTAFSSDANTKLLIHSDNGGNVGAYGTAQADGKKYYYTDIKGSKPIKDPRIGAHFGGQRHTVRSIQLLEQETATHGGNVWSIDGREWCRVLDTDAKNLVLNNNADGVRISANGSDCTGFTFELTGYFNDFNIISSQTTDACDDIDITINGTLTIDGSTTLGGRAGVANPKSGRYVDRGTVINAGLSIALGINTLKYECKTGSSEYIDISGFELIAQDTTSTATKSKIQIPSQNVVSYGKKFTVSGTPHYNPFAFKTDGTTAWTSGAHNGTSWPVGTGSSANIDTATSLGLANWLHSSNYYKPYNGGRVVWWIDSSGTLKCSVTVMPPNARSIGNSASLTNATAKANASVANNTFYPTMEAGAIDHSLSEVAKTFYVSEFGNGGANGNASWKDVSVLTGSSTDVAYVMDDGLTSLTGDDVLNASNEGIQHADNDDTIFSTFIGTGISITVRANAGGTDAYDKFIDGIQIVDGEYSRSTTYHTEVLAQNLPYGTHILKMFRQAANQWNERYKELTFYQPKMPPIPEDAVVLADYMLMADFVAAGASASADTLSKGTRRSQCSRDWFYNTALSLGFSTDANRLPRGIIGYEIASTINTSLPYFGTHAVFENHPHSNRMNNAVLAGSTQSLETNTHIHISESTMGVQDATIVGSQSGEYVSIPCIDVHTPIHTSSHYQTFESPFLKELVGGDRNMEQNNLVVTPDGKTWDQVTRDTSYLGNCVLLTHTDNQTNWSTYAVFDEWRGDSTALSSAGAHNRCNKDFAIAYDRFICLVDGQYQLTHTTRSNHATHQGGWSKNDEMIFQHSGFAAGNEMVGNYNVTLKRGDYLRYQGQFGYDTLMHNYVSIIRT